MVNEVWKPIAGFENLYEISNLGRVKRVFDATSNLDRGRLGRVLKPNLSSKYPTVKLYKNKKGFTALLHRLVAIAFIPNPDEKPIVNHKNANKLDWSLANLEWVTHSENLLHAISLDLNPSVGETHHKAVFNPETVFKLRASWDGTYAWCLARSKEYLVNTNTIRLLVLGKTWKSVPMPDKMAAPSKLLRSRTVKHKKKRTEISYSQQKLTDEKVLAARREYSQLDKKFGFIKNKADTLGVDRKTLQKAIVGETFKHLPLSGRA